MDKNIRKKETKKIGGSFIVSLKGEELLVQLHVNITTFKPQVSILKDMERECENTSSSSLKDIGMCDEHTVQEPSSSSSSSSSIKYIKHRFLEQCNVCVSNYDEQETAFLTSLLQCLGASVSQSYHSECTHLISAYQDGEAFEQALQEKKVIATSQWLEDCISLKGVIHLYELREPYSSNKVMKLINPIYYPLKSRNGIPGMENCVITTLNFGKKDLRRLQYLIVSCGAKYAGKISRKITHLIDRLRNCENIDKCQTNNIKIVSKEWLFECIHTWEYVSEIPFLYQYENPNSENMPRLKRIRDDVKEIASKRKRTISSKHRLIVFPMDQDHSSSFLTQDQEPQILIAKNSENVGDWSSILDGKTFGNEFERISIEQMKAMGKGFLAIPQTDEIQDTHELVAKKQTPNQTHTFQWESETGLVYDARMCLYEGDFPETPNRLSSIWNRLEQKLIPSKCIVIRCREVEIEELLLFHDETYIFNTLGRAKLLNECGQDSSSSHQQAGLLDDYSLKAAKLATGGLVKLTEMIGSYELNNGIAIVRPPGILAQKNEPSDFCIFNNIAVAARVAQNKYPHIHKILIVYFGMHHGNRMHKVFGDDATVLCFSLRLDHKGKTSSNEHQKSKMDVSISLPLGDFDSSENNVFGDAEYIALFDHIFMPVAKEFSPDLVFVAASFEDSDLIKMKLTHDGYANALKKLLMLAKGRVVVSLESGGVIEKTVQCIESCANIILGEEPKKISSRKLSLSMISTIRNSIGIYSKYWDCLKTWNDLLDLDSLQDKTKDKSKIHDINTTLCTPNISINECNREVITVDSSNPLGFQSISQVLSFINCQLLKKDLNCIIINVKPGVYSEKIKIDDSIHSIPIIINGDGSMNKEVVIEGERDIIQLSGGNTIVEIRNLTLRNTEIGNEKSSAYAICCKGTTDKCKFIACSFVGVSLIVDCGSIASVSSCDISQSCMSGILTKERSSLFASKCSVTYNETGIISLENSFLDIRDCHFIKNSKFGVLAKNCSGEIGNCLICGNQFSGIQLLGGSVHIKNNKICKQNQAGIVLNDKNSSLVEGNDIYGNRFAGVEIGAGSKPVVRRNHIHHGWQSGILFVKDSVAHISENEVNNNAYCGIEVRYASPFLVQNKVYRQKQAGIGVSGVQCKSIIDSNEIFENEYAGIEVKDFACPIVSRNKIHHGKQHGIHIFENGSGSFEQNDVFLNKHDGIAVQGNSTPMVSKCKIHHNEKNGVLNGQKGCASIVQNEIYRNGEAGLKLMSSGTRCAILKNRIFEHMNENCGYAVCATHYTNAVIQENEMFGNMAKPQFFFTSDCQITSSQNTIN